MSLIFLKNDDRSVSSVVGGNSMMKPYKWSNFFTEPLKLAPNSQVAYIKSLTHSSGIEDVENADEVYMTIGIPQLNAPMRLRLNEKNIDGFVQYINNIGLNCNLFGTDNNFNHIYYEEDQSIDGGSVLQDFYDTGFNWYATDDKKVKIRATQRGVNDVFNQLFNNLNTSTDGILVNAPNGINTTGTNADDTTIYNEARLLASNGLAGDAIAQPSTNLYGNPVNNGSQAPVKDNTASFYNSNFAFNTITNPTPVSYVSDFGNNDITASYQSNTTEHQQSMIFTTTGIKQNVFMDAPPTANGGGHASIAGSGSGGYCIIGFKSKPQTEANIAFPNALFPNREGFCGICPHSFGVHSAQYIDDEFDDDAEQSRNDFLNVNDLNENGGGGVVGTAMDYRDAYASGAYARYLFGCDIQVIGGDYVAVVKVLDPEANFAESAYKVVQTLSLNEVSSGYEPIYGNPFQGGVQGGPSLFHLNTANTTGGKIPTQIWFRIRWTSPYTMGIEYCLSITGAGQSYSVDTDEPFEPDTGNHTDPTNQWIMMYDMLKDPALKPNYLIPSYYGDMRVIDYPSNYVGNHFCIKGYFDSRYSYRGNKADADGANEMGYLFQMDKFWKGWYDNDDDASVLVQDFQGIYTTQKLGNIKGEVIPEGFVSAGTNAGYSEKKIQFLLNELVSEASRDKILNDKGEPMLRLFNPPFLHLGSQLGLITSKTATKDLLTLSDDILGSGNKYVVQGVNGTNEYSQGNDDFSLHFQLTNFPIQSKQGVKSTSNKTIEVVNNLELSNRELNNYTSHAHSSKFPNWIDLNNYGELNLNRIDVLITNDDNEPAFNLSHHSSMVVAFRAKPKRDEGYVPDNIPVMNRM